ncbi:AAA family ATPase [Rossellomorea vietnamensis]|uniref:ATP-binding protein n=1 Tax=Rossellomorea vietnamensis TaxID=218284 RepID=UPI001CCD8236|nr:ATP-binding protein [Rossellomorea vietnamensis]MCA0151138.1 AAA family ATPase [Rossellomorea vietnamensis]
MNWNEKELRIEGVHCKAEYKEQFNEANQGNPFIEALPNRLGVEQFYNQLYSAPRIKKDHLNLEIEDRLELVQQIRPSFWLPMPNHYDKYRGLYTMIKIGYQSRNPLLAIFNKQFAIGWDKILEGGLDDNGANIAGNIQTAQSSCEIGISGMGKSKIYERMLKQLFPQVIHHTKYKTKNLLMTQVVWLHIECPSGKSVGALCKNFYSEVDKILGSNFYEKHGEKGGNIDTLAKRMVKVAAQINLGVLVVDEIQNVHKAHSGGDERIIQFLTELVNTMGIPVILIGTFKAMYLFKKSLATTRRGIPDSYNENVTSFLVEDSWEWDEFIQSLWSLQYTKKYTVITDELKQAMYYHSLGIPDIAVKLFMHVQAQAILNCDEEQITPELISGVAAKTLRILDPIARKIREGLNSAELIELDDVQPEWSQFNAYLKEAELHNNLSANVRKRVYQQRNESLILEELINFANNLVLNVETAKSIASTVYQANIGLDKQQMMMQIAELILNNENQRDSTKSKNINPISKKQVKNKYKLEKGDIRLIVEVGRKKGLSNEESLIEAELIKKVDELINHV